MCRDQEHLLDTSQNDPKSLNLESKALPLGHQTSHFYISFLTMI